MFNLLIFFFQTWKVLASTEIWFAVPCVSQPTGLETPMYMFRIVFWDVLPCKMIVHRRFRGAYCLHHQGSSLKRRSTIILHGSTSQKTILNIILAAVRTWNLTPMCIFDNVIQIKYEWAISIWMPHSPSHLFCFIFEICRRMSKVLNYSALILYYIHLLPTTFIHLLS
jgi:hypothetical protein